MRRENLKQQGGGDAYIDWLKSKGCRFYAPMDAEHGLSELIQGWIPNINPDAGFSCEWQQSQQAYMLDSSQTYKCALMYNGGTVNSGYVNKVIPSTGLTYVFDVYMTNDKTLYETPLGGGGADDFRLDALNGVRTTFPTFTREIFNRNGMAMSLNRWYTIILRYDHGNNDCYFVDNRMLYMVESVANPTWTQTYTTYMNTHVSMCGACTVYIKNVYVFGVAAGDSDIIDIYNHDHQ